MAQWFKVYLSYAQQYVGTGFVREGGRTRLDATYGLAVVPLLRAPARTGVKAASEMYLLIQR